MDARFILYFVVPLSLGIVITLVGVILLFVDSRKKPKAGEINIEDWPTTGGKVTTARLGEKQTGDTYEPVIEYVYTVNDAQYHGNKIFPGENPSSKKEAAQEILNKHPVNMFVPVRYNPTNPSESALEVQSQPMNFLVLAGWVLSGFGVLSCCFTAFMTLVIFGAAQ